MLPSFINLVVYIVTVNIRVQVLCRCKFSTPLGKYQGAQLLDYTVRVFLVLKETAKMSSKVAEPFCISVFTECSCSTSSPAFGVVSVLGFPHSNRQWWYHCYVDLKLHYEV